MNDDPSQATLPEAQPYYCDPKTQVLSWQIVLLILKLLYHYDYFLLSTTALRPIPRYRTCHFSINCALKQFLPSTTTSTWLFNTSNNTSASTISPCSVVISIARAFVTASPTELTVFSYVYQLSKLFSFAPLLKKIS